MKKFTLLALLLVTGVAAMAQRPANAEQINRQDTYQERFDQVFGETERQLPAASMTAPQTAVQQVGKTAAVNPVVIGSASNIYSILRCEQNQVWSDQTTNTVGFVHRHNTAFWGGNSGILRYDISVDGGTSFTPDVGPITPTSSLPARYPNITLYNPTGSSTPTDAFTVYAAPTVGATWDGHVAGATDVVTSGAVAGTENYIFNSSNTLLPGGLTEGQAGEFWYVEAAYDGSAATGPIYVYKGTWNSATNDVEFVRDSVVPNHYVDANGGPVLIGPNISFSPDGNTAWIAWLGDLDGGSSGFGAQDSTIQACFVKSTDGGNTWGSPIEVSANTDAYVADYLTSFWISIDSATGDTVPVGTGRATLAFDYDLTVDINGNPHLAAVVGNGTSQASPTPGYSIFSGVEKFFADITSPDGGASWDVKFISPILTFRGTFPQNGTNTVTQDNQPQISRTENGDHIFYAWADSDTNSATGVGFGVSDNLLPNLRVAGCRVSDGAQTCPKLITDGDAIWEGAALFPTLAPTVILQSNGVVEMPIVMVELTNGDVLQPCTFYYFGGDATIDALNDFGVADSLDLTWDAISSGDCENTVVVANDVTIENRIEMTLFPNPTNGDAFAEFTLPFAADINLNVVNMYGQTVATIANGEYAAGTHRIAIDTRELAGGVYFYNLATNNEVVTKKLVVTK